MGGGEVPDDMACNWQPFCPTNVAI